MNDLPAQITGLSSYYPSGYPDAMRLLGEQMANVTRAHTRLHEFIHGKDSDFVPLEVWATFYIETGKVYEAFFKFCLVAWPPKTGNCPKSDCYLAKLAPARKARLKREGRIRTVHQDVLNGKSVLSESALLPLWKDARAVYGLAHIYARSMNGSDSNKIVNTISPLKTLIEANCFVVDQDPDHPWRRTLFLDNMRFDRIWGLYDMRNKMAHFNNVEEVRKLRYGQTTEFLRAEYEVIKEDYKVAVEELGEWLVKFHRNAAV